MGVVWDMQSGRGQSLINSPIPRTHICYLSNYLLAAEFSAWLSHRLAL
jgi:hypothetical protein